MYTLLVCLGLRYMFLELFQYLHLCEAVLKYFSSTLNARVESEGDVESATIDPASESRSVMLCLLQPPAGLGIPCDLVGFLLHGI
jgi:hypothetical protein